MPTRRISKRTDSKDFIASVLVVDDEKPIQDMLRDFLSSEGYHVLLAGSAEKAIEQLKGNTVDIVISDLKMPGRSGIDLLLDLRNSYPDIIPIMMTGYGTLESSIAAIKNGAYDYVLKPFKIDDVLLTIRRAVEKKFLEQENRQLRQALELYDSSEEIYQTLSSKKVLSMALETSFNLLQPDVAVMYLRDDTSGRYHMESFMAKDPQHLDTYTGSPNLEKMVTALTAKNGLFLRDKDAGEFFKSPLKKGPLKYFFALPLRSNENLLGFINIYQYSPYHKITETQRTLLMILASRAANAVENALLFEELKDTFKETIEGFARSLEAKDKYTSGHSARVKLFTSMVADGYSLKGHERDVITEAALLHDIGKLSVDLSTLNCAKGLSKQQVDLFRSHPIKGKEILEPISLFSEIVPIVYHHHENFDGTGYPDGVAGNQIPFGARIIAVVDSYDAMTSDRAYRRSLGHDYALKELQDCADSQFDPEIVKVFCEEIERCLADESIRRLLDHLRD